MVKSVKLQFRQCHSNKYTALSPSLPSPTPRPALQRWPFMDSGMNFNRCAFVGVSYTCKYEYENDRMAFSKRAHACSAVRTGTLVADLKHRRFVGISLPCRGSQAALPPTPYLSSSGSNRQPTVMWKCRTRAGAKPYLCTQSHAYTCRHLFFFHAAILLLFTVK